jgi:hypothetical protein
MGEVYALPTLANVCNMDAIETLERFLDRARKGEITTVALAALTVDGNALFTYSQQMNGLALLGACNLLQHDLTTALIREGE